MLVCVSFWQVGLGFEEALAREALTESRAVQLGHVALRPRDWLIEEPPSSIVTRRKKLGEQSSEELARMAEEIVRAHKEASGVTIAGPTSFVENNNKNNNSNDSGEGAAKEQSQEYRDAGAHDESSEEIRDMRLKSRLLVRSHVRVPLEKDEFVNFFASLTATMTPDDVQKYLDVFFLMNSLKGSAGVQPTTVDTAKQLKGADSRVR